MTTRTTALLENGRGPVFTPRISYNSFIVVVGASGTILANSGLGGGLCRRRANCVNGLGRIGCNALVTRGDSFTVRLTVGNVLPSDALNHGRLAEYHVFGNTSRGRRTRGPRT